MDKQFNPSPMSEQYIEIAFCPVFLTRKHGMKNRILKEIEYTN